MLGLAVVAVFQILTLPAIDKRLTLALYCFAVSIPLLTVFFRALLVEDACVYRDPVWYVPVFSILGTQIWFAGLAAVFFHFSYKIGFVFLTLAILGLWVSGRYRARLLRLNNPQ